jgi:glc operon protein GlcG
VAHVLQAFEIRCGGMRVKTVPVLDYEDAKQIVDAIYQKALQSQKAAVIAVCDAHGELIALSRMDGAPLSSIRVATNKAWTAARERKSTKDIGDKVRHPEKGFDIAYYGDNRFVGWGGGLPLSKNGHIVGAIGVSGLSSAEDIALATIGVELLAKEG